jgi:hypothetical protein
MPTKNDQNTLNVGGGQKENKKISMASSPRIGKRAEKKSFLDMVSLIRSIQRAEGYTDCFQMGMTDCDQLGCKWRSFCLEVYPVLGKDES